MSVQPVRGQSPDSELARATSQSLSLYPVAPSASGPTSADRRVQLERATQFAMGAGQPSWGSAAPSSRGLPGSLTGTASLQVTGRAAGNAGSGPMLADDSHGSTDTYGLPPLGPDGSPPAMHRGHGWAPASTTSPAQPPRAFPQEDATGAVFGADFSGRGIFPHQGPPPGFVGGPTGLSPPGRADTLPFSMHTPMAYGGAAPVGGFSLTGSIASGGSFGPEDSRVARGSAGGDPSMRVAGLSSATSASGYHAKRMREMPSEGSSVGLAAMGSFGVPSGPGQIADTPVATAGEAASYEQQRRDRLLGVMTSALLGNRDSKAFGKWVFVPPHHIGVIPGLQAAVCNEALVLGQDDLLTLATSAMRNAEASGGQSSSSGAGGAHGGHDSSQAAGAPIVADGSHDSLFSPEFGQGPRSRAAAGTRPPVSADQMRQAHSSRLGPGQGIAAPPPSGSSASPLGTGRRRITPPTMHRPLPGGAPDSGRKRDRDSRGGDGSSSSSSSSRPTDGLPPRPEGAAYGGPGNGLHILKHAADSLGAVSAPHGASTAATALASSSPQAGPLSGPPPLSPADSDGGRALSSVDSSGRVMSRMRRSLVHDARVAEGTRSGTVSSKDGVSWGRVNNPISFVEHSDLPAAWPRVPFPRDYLITNLPPDDARTGRLTRAAVHSLRTWMTQGRTWLSPYPTPSDIATLSDRTSMSPKQLRDWFRNERKRVWLPFWQSRLSDPSCPWAVQRSSGGRANIIPKDVLDRFSHYSSDLDLNTAITLDLEAARGASGPGAPAPTGGGGAPGAAGGAAAFGGSPGASARRA